MTSDSLCPTWCTADHAVEDRLGPRIHCDDGTAVPVVTAAGGALPHSQINVHAVTAQIEREERDHERFLVVTIDSFSVRLTGESARRLAKTAFLLSESVR